MSVLKAPFRTYLKDFSDALGKYHLKPMGDDMSSLIPTAIILLHML